MLPLEKRREEKRIQKLKLLLPQSVDRGFRKIGFCPWIGVNGLSPKG